MGFPRFLHEPSWHLSSFLWLSKLLALAVQGWSATVSTRATLLSSSSSSWSTRFVVITCSLCPCLIFSLLLLTTSSLPACSLLSSHTQPWIYWWMCFYTSIKSNASGVTCIHFSSIQLTLLEYCLFELILLQHTLYCRVYELYITCVIQPYKVSMPSHMMFSQRK